MASPPSNFPPQPAILSRAPTRNSNPFPGLSSGDAGPPEDNCVNHDALAYPHEPAPLRQRSL